MKRCVLVLATLAACAPSESTISFTIPEPDLIPEGIAYDPVDEAFFVGSTFKRKIVRIAADGSVSDFTAPGQDGMWGVVGMEVDVERRLLWAAGSHAGMGMPMVDMVEAEEGSSGVWSYALPSGRLARRVVLSGDAGAHFLNDLTIASDGTVYVTDSATPTVYRVPPDRDTLEAFVRVEGTAFPNGISLSDDEAYLFVALSGDVGRIHVATGALELLARPEGITVDADGLYFHEGSLITVWPGTERHGVTRYPLDDDLAAIVGVEPILSEHPAYLQPTTGAIVGSTIHVIANAQLQLFRAMYEADRSYDPAMLAEPVVLAVALGR